MSGVPELGGVTMSRRRTMLMNGQEENEMKEWKLIYDSGETTEEIISTPKISVSGCTEIMIIARVVPTATNDSSRNGQVVIISPEGNKCMCILGNALLYPGENPRMSVARVRKVSDFIYVDTSTSLNANDAFNNKLPTDNLSNVLNTIVKFEGEMNEIYLTNLNENTKYRFGVGSRFAVYGR